MTEHQLPQTSTPLDVLVCGAGIAGSAVAGLLQRSGHRVTLIERAGAHAPAGYMLALFPLAEDLFHALGLSQAYRRHSIELANYRLYDRHGALLREDRLGELMGAAGSYRGIGRAGLLQLLRSAAVPASYNTILTDLQVQGEQASVTLQNPERQWTQRFDLVIVAEGMNSSTRTLLQVPTQRLNTGWGGWVVWEETESRRSVEPGGAAEPESPATGSELWGNGYFMGAYPVPGATGFFLGGPSALCQAGPAGFLDTVYRGTGGIPQEFRTVGDILMSQQHPYYWSLEDVRASRWVNGPVVLLGDAAAGFLPTAGIGAGMALDSAWLLAGALAEHGRYPLPQLLSGYLKAARPRVLAAQDNSRRLARLMFRRSAAWAAVRDALTRRASVAAVLGPIRSIIDTRPDIGGLLRQM
ncbi:NAD(P)/FAD-dependent oxidoreductase [Glutamicibacter creatinolyticus]|uniref:FAD-dependent oxidoreductase n=1 Tax=Glutamicibacter creatinolyticus TaxID=162496 RepID=UPI0033F69A22